MAFRDRLPGLGFELNVALRFLLEGRFQSLLIIVGVAAGVAVVAYISALVTGLQRNTLEKTLGAQAHVVVSPPDERVVPAMPRSGQAWVLSDTQARAQRLRTVADWPAVVTALERRQG
ncbi:MAG TPA: ABC transporter permease, partial [Aquabacterium sp.]|nr:ABC transporter permease [Aquabacterium sp.]